MADKEKYKKALKKKKKRLRKVSMEDSGMGLNAQYYHLGKSVKGVRERSGKQKAKFLIKNYAVGAGLTMAEKQLKKAYNKYVDKVNKKRGYK